MSSTVNIGVIGAGWWATYAHIPGILGHPHARLHSVQKRERDEAERVAKDFGATHAFSDVDEMLASKDLDAVVVSCTPNVHFVHARAALERGLHVLVEKPMTINAAEARELTALAERRGVQLLISCPWHYTAHAREARRLIQSGGIGRVKMVSILMTNPVHELLRGTSTSPTHGAESYLEPEPGSYSDPAIAGGGQIYCQVSHAAAYVTYLTGSRPSQVFAHLDNDGAAVDIYDSVSARFERGEIVSIASTGATPLSQRHYEIRVYGTEGVLVLELWRGTMEYATFGGESRLWPSLTEDQLYPDQAPVRNLIDVALGKATNGSPGTLGVAAMEVIEAACESARSGRNVVIGRDLDRRHERSVVGATDAGVRIVGR